MNKVELTAKLIGTGDQSLIAQIDRRLREAEQHVAALQDRERKGKIGITAAIEIEVDGPRVASLTYAVALSAPKPEPAMLHVHARGGRLLEAVRASIGLRKDLLRDMLGDEWTVVSGEHVQVPRFTPWAKT